MFLIIALLFLNSSGSYASDINVKDNWWLALYDQNKNITQLKELNKTAVEKVEYLESIVNYSNYHYGFLPKDYDTKMDAKMTQTEFVNYIDAGYCLIGSETKAYEDVFKGKPETFKYVNVSPDASGNYYASTVPTTVTYNVVLKENKIVINVLEEAKCSNFVLTQQGDERENEPNIYECKAWQTTPAVDKALEIKECGSPDDEITQLKSYWTKKYNIPFQN